ncbi:MAG: hypothetical protein ACFE8A_06690 [Candidatus Hodarchaeota archaeon]
MSKDKTFQISQLSFKELQNKIEDFKKKRDDLNQKTKEYINRLQEIEFEIIESLKTARDVYKPKRDHWNKKVKQLKNKKIEYKKLLDTLIDEKKKHQKQNGNGQISEHFTSVKQLERKIDNLERVIETENLDINKENEIVDKIRDLERKKQKLVAEQQNNGIYKIGRKIEIVKINLNKIYEQLAKWSGKSQKFHMKMLELYQEANQLKENKKKIEEELIENKKAADRYHDQYLKVINQKKKRNKSKRFYRPKRRPIKGQRQKQADKNQEMLEKLKQKKLAVALEKRKTGKKLNLYEARLILEHSEDKS